MPAVRPCERRPVPGEEWNTAPFPLAQVRGKNKPAAGRTLHGTGQLSILTEGNPSPSGLFDRCADMNVFDYEKLCDFQNLYLAYKASRRSKRNKREVIEFEMETGTRIAELSEELRNGTYRLSGYYHFTVHDPKVREIYALHYRDRIVQHCLCDRLLAPYFETHLIYDNAACRKNKGTHFALNRLEDFLHAHYREYGTEGYILKCDIRKFFDSIPHEILKQRLLTLVHDKRTGALLEHIVDSYAAAPGRGIPMGNQTSQWFALYYLDPLDRLIKEQLRIKHYTRYMDDMVLVHKNKEYLQDCLQKMRILAEELGLAFNAKTQIFPIKNGVEYLGWRLYLTEEGAVVRKLKKQSCRRMKRRLRKLKRDTEAGLVAPVKAEEALTAYGAHLAHGNAHRLYASAVRTFRLARGSLA